MKLQTVKGEEKNLSNNQRSRMLGLTQVTAVLTSNSQVRRRLKTSVCILIARDSVGYKVPLVCVLNKLEGRKWSVAAETTAVVGAVLRRSELE